MQPIPMVMFLTYGLAAAAMTEPRAPSVPGSAWRRGDPGQAGLNPNVLEAIGELMQQAHANGVVIHRGVLVADWTFDGPAGKRFNIQSCTKVVTSTVLGLALQNGLVPNWTWWSPRSTTGNAVPTSASIISNR